MTYGACLSCAGSCCRTYLVPVTVADVRRLVAATALHPVEFLEVSPALPGIPGFVLVPGRPPQMLVLDRRDRVAWNDHAAACTFLVELPNGQGRCGVYADRPVGCRTFPTVLRNGSAVVRGDVICRPGRGTSRR